MFTFVPRKEADEDPRVDFANSVCDLLWAKFMDLDNEVTIDSIREDIEKYYEHFENNVRNIYETIGSKIPLFALYELEISDKDNWGISQAEFRACSVRTFKACKEYYEQKEDKG